MEPQLLCKAMNSDNCCGGMIACFPPFVSFHFFMHCKQGHEMLCFAAIVDIKQIVSIQEKRAWVRKVIKEIYSTGRRGGRRDRKGKRMSYGCESARKEKERVSKQE